MSLSRALPIASLALAIGLSLSACTLTPVHSDGGARSAALAFRYAEPDNRNEQVFFNALSEKLGQNRSGAAPLFDATVSVSASRIGLSRVSSPVNDYQVIATASYTVEINGETVINDTRTATGGYQTTGQIVADDEARTAAEEQTVKALADTVRLALFAQLEQR